MASKVNFESGKGLTRYVYDLFRDNYEFTGDPLRKLDYRRDASVEVDHANKTFTIEQ